MRREDNYISVAMFQLRLDLGCDSKSEFLITTEDYYNQMESSIGIIHKLKPDVVVFPEMSYSKHFEEAMMEISKSTLVVFGSEYIGDNNTTIIFQAGRKNELIKRYPSGAEPMARKYRRLSATDFISKYLSEHTFTVKGQKIIVLNCLEYYHVAYFIARDSELQDIFGFVVPCSNSNTSVFLQETMALHNHNENIYSFVCNTKSVYNGENYGDGNSYIFGPVQKHEKQWLKQEFIPCFEHMCSIAKLDESSACIYGEFAILEQISRFGRSDFYQNTPQNVTISNLL